MSGSVDGDLSAIWPAIAAQRGKRYCAGYMLSTALMALGVGLLKHPHSLRFGLPGREADWSQLQAALEAC